MRKRPLRLLSALALSGGLLLSGTSLASAASAVNINVTLPAVTKTTYSISGIVYNAAGTAGVQSVEVVADSTGFWGTGYSGRANTTASGAYSIAGLLPGSYHLSFYPPRTANLQTGYRGGTSPGYFTTNSDSAAAQTITAASLTARNVRLPNGFKISGKVTRTDGVTAIAGLAVSASGTLGYDATTSDSVGNYVLMGLSPGSYEVDFSNGYTALNFQTGAYYTGNTNKFSTTLHSTVAVTTANVSGINPRIPVGLIVTGYVKTRATTPVPIDGAFVSSNGPTWASAETDASGKFEILGLNPGSYQFSVQADGYQNGSYSSTGPNYWTSNSSSASNVTVTSNVTLPTIKPATATVVTSTGYYISGRVTTTAGASLSDITVNAAATSGYASASTDGFGYYSVGPVPAGTYKLSLGGSYNYPELQNGYYGSASPTYFTSVASSATGIPVSANVTGKNIQIPRGLTIGGVISITGGQACIDCRVAAIRSSDSTFTNAYTDSSGAYKLIGLGTGSYKIEIYGYYATTTSRLLTVSDGYYKSGVTGNYSSTETSATAVAVS